MTRAVLSIGSNMDDPPARLAAALAFFGSAVVAVSAVYRTPPWGGVRQADFCNQAVLVDDDDRDAYGWLQLCQEAERAADRRRVVRWGPRTLDADVIAVWTVDGPVFSDDPNLLLPHPRAAERAFVLVPWAELDPSAELPGVGPISSLLAGLDLSEIRRAG